MFASYSFFSFAVFFFQTAVVAWLSVVSHFRCSDFICSCRNFLFLSISLFIIQPLFIVFYHGFLTMMMTLARALARFLGWALQFLGSIRLSAHQFLFSTAQVYLSVYAYLYIYKHIPNIVAYL